jgi:hypothetical protein
MYYLQVAIISTSVVMPILAGLAVAARFQARRVKSLGFEADDWTTLLALVCPNNHEPQHLLVTDRCRLS